MIVGEDTYMEWLEDNAHVLRATIHSGNPKAASIASLYTLHHDLPGDQVAQTLLICSINDFIAQQKAPPPPSPSFSRMRTVMSPAELIHRHARDTLAVYPDPGEIGLWYIGAGPDKVVVVASLTTAAEADLALRNIQAWRTRMLER